MQAFGLELYKIAADIGSPIAIAATTILLFFLLLKLVLSKFEAPIKKISGTQAFVVVMSVITYGLIVTVIAAVGGLGLYGYEKYYEKYALKQDLISQAERALENQESGNAIEIGKNIIRAWPNDYQGYRILANAHYLNGDYKTAGKTFDMAISFVENANKCDVTFKNLTASSVAAHASAGDLKAAAKRMEVISGCSLEKGMLFNHAKLMIFTGEPDLALKILNDSRLRNKSRPDYRDRTAFEAGVAHMVRGKERWQVAALNEFVRASCLNEKFGKLVNSVVISSATDPPGSLTQGFDLETQFLRESKFQEFLQVLKEKMEKSDACEKIQS